MLVPLLILAAAGAVLLGWRVVDRRVDGQEATVAIGNHPVRYSRYTDPSAGFSISYPSNWTTPEDRFGAAIALASPPQGSGDEFVENVRVSVYDVGIGTSLDAFEAEGLELMADGFIEFDLHSSKRVFLGGRMAFEDHYTGRLQQGRFEGLQVTALAGTKAYVVTYTGEPGTGFATWLPLAREILDSFTIMGG